MISSREVYQCLRDAAMGVARLQVMQAQTVRIDGWQLVLERDAEGLACCLRAVSPDGRQATQADWPRYGTNPVDHLSLWERRQIERLLAGEAVGEVLDAAD